MDTTTIRRRLRSRSTLCIAVFGVILLVVGTASVSEALDGRQSSKRVEWAIRRAKRVGTRPSGGQSLPTTTTPTTTVPTTTASSTTASSTTASTTTTGSTSTTRETTTTPSTTAATTTVTSTTTRPTTTTTGTTPGAAGCGLAGAVFCETFDAPAGAGTRTGDLDPVLWGVSRVGNINPGGHISNDVARTSLVGCGSTAWSFTPSDVRICNGRLFEAVNDGGIVASLHTYPKQPFDFAGRTGRIVFDVSADSDGSHGAWPEFVITDKPVPGTRVNISGGIAGQYAFNEVGFSLDGCTSGPGGSTGVGRVFVARNGVYAEPPVTGVGCVSKGSAAALNHFEVRLSQNRMEVWGTDPGSSTLKQLAVADNLGLTFTKGLVWLDDVHYNARKSIEPCECGTQWNHTFVWDNLAFDGPKTYRDLGFDVADANTTGDPATAGDPTRRTGFQVGTGPLALTVPGVRRDQTPTGALVVLNTYSFATVVPSVSVNGGPWIDTAFPPGAPTNGWLSLAIPVPLEQVHDGTNTLTFKSGDWSTTIANISIILVAGSPVP